MGIPVLHRKRWGWVKNLIPVEYGIIFYCEDGDGTVNPAPAMPHCRP